jgi:hypothetical protein
MVIAVNRVGINLTSGYNTAYFSRVAKACPVSSTALQDGSFLICKAGGLAWFVAPTSTQLSSQWANGQYNTTNVGVKCCVSEWGTLSSLLSACRYTPTEWFVPSIAQLQNPGYTCRTNWGTPTTCYWSSQQQLSFPFYYACSLDFGTNSGCILSKTNTFCVRAFRCVTY